MRQPPKLPKSSRRRRVAIAAVLLWSLGCGSTSWAQTSLPGIVISTPPAGQPQPAPQIIPPFGRPTPPAPPPAVVAPPPAPPAPAAKAAVPKPKPKVASAAPTEGTGKGSGGTQSIILLVNDEPITALDIEQRARLNALAANIGDRASANMKALVKSESTQLRFRAMVEQIVKENQSSKSRDQILAMIEQRKTQFAQQLQQEAIASARSSMMPSIKKGTLDELIDERLKIQEAKRLNVTVEDAQIDDILKGMAERNKMTPNQFVEHLKSVGTDISAMRSRFKATLSWNEVIRRRFSAQVNVSQKDVDKFSAGGPSGEDDVELQLQRITLTVPAKIDQKALSERFADADRVRRSFGGCKTASATAARLPGAKFEDLGSRKPSSIVEPLRSHLLGARDGEMVPPSIGDGAIELYAVCSRKVVKADDKRRNDVEADLRQKEFEILAKGHLRNLRQDAHLDCRTAECKK